MHCVFLWPVSEIPHVEKKVSFSSFLPSPLFKKVCAKAHSPSSLPFEMSQSTLLSRSLTSRPSVVYIVVFFACLHCKHVAAKGQF